MEDLDEEEAAMLKAFRAKKKAAKEKKLAAERAVGVEGRSVDNSGRSADAPQSGSGKGEDTTMTPQDLRTQLEQVVEGIKLLLTQGELDKATSAAATLHSVASKLLLAEKDPKYRSINLNNTKLQAKLFWGDELSHGARKVLEALGFAMTDKNTRMTLAAADEKPELLRVALELLGDAKSGVSLREIGDLIGASDKNDDSDVAMRPVPEYDIRECRVALASLQKQIQTTELNSPVGVSASSASAKGNDPNEIVRQALLQRAKGEMTHGEVAFMQVLKRLEKIAATLQSSDNAKFRKLDTTKLKWRAEWKGGLDFLSFIGFRPAAEEKYKWLLSVEKEHPVIIDRALTIVRRVQKESEPSMEELLTRGAMRAPPPRELKVLDAVQVAQQKKTQFIHQDDAKGDGAILLQAMRDLAARNAAENPDMFVTRAKRQEEKEKKKKVYEKTVIRVMFASHDVLIEGSFSPYERVSKLFDFVASKLLVPNMAFCLSHPPSKPIIDPRSNSSSSSSSSSGSFSEFRASPSGRSRLLDKVSKGNKRSRQKPSSLEPAVNATLLALRLVPAATLFFNAIDAAPKSGPAQPRKSSHKSGYVLGGGQQDEKISKPILLGEVLTQKASVVEVSSVPRPMEVEKGPSGEHNQRQQSSGTAKKKAGAGAAASSREEEMLARLGF